MEYFRVYNSEIVTGYDAFVGRCDFFGWAGTADPVADPATCPPCYILDSSKAEVDKSLQDFLQKYVNICVDLSDLPNFDMAAFGGDCWTRIRQLTITADGPTMVATVMRLQPGTHVLTSRECIEDDTGAGDPAITGATFPAIAGASDPAIAGAPAKKLYTCTFVRRDLVPASARATICAAIMAKNESRSIGRTLETCVPAWCDALVIHDTGSTDNTLDVCRYYAHRFKIPIHIIESKFVDFAVSRNAMLAFAAGFDYDYLLMLDSGDEVRGSGLREFVENHNGMIRQYRAGPLSAPVPPPTLWSAFLMRQNWRFQFQTSEYWTNRLIRNGAGWFYKMPVHEFLSIAHTGLSASASELRKYEQKGPASVIIYQDRTFLINQTTSRYGTDRDMLLAEIARISAEGGGIEPRCAFYLAQTYSSLGDAANAYKWYVIRSKLNGFTEEVFVSLMRAAELFISAMSGTSEATASDTSDTSDVSDASDNSKESWTKNEDMYIAAYNYDRRAEPLIAIAKHYLAAATVAAAAARAYMYAQMACDIPYPAHRILFVNKLAYDKIRWNLLANAAWACIDAMPESAEQKSVAQKKTLAVQAILQNGYRACQMMFAYTLSTSAAPGSMHSIQSNASPSSVTFMADLALRRKYEQALEYEAATAAVMRRIEHVVYINLDKRTDRRAEIEAELKGLFSETCVERFAAIEDVDGAIGCTRSHIAVLRKAIDKKWNNILVLEDDAVAYDLRRASHTLATLFAQKFDVLMLGSTFAKYDKKTSRLSFACGGHAYFLEKKYFATLLDNFETGLSMLIKDPNRDKFALDRYWQPLMLVDSWLVAAPNIFIQRPGTSDIVKRNVDYFKYFLL